jgi:hypothetical protein
MWLYKTKRVSTIIKLGSYIVNVLCQL